MIDGFVAQRGGTLLARVTEVESGRNTDRPELGKEMHLAKVTGPTLSETNAHQEFIDVGISVSQRAGVERAISKPADL